MTHGLQGRARARSPPELRSFQPHRIACFTFETPGSTHDALHTIAAARGRAKLSLAALQLSGAPPGPCPDPMWREEAKAAWRRPARGAWAPPPLGATAWRHCRHQLPGRRRLALVHPAYFLGPFRQPSHPPPAGITGSNSSSSSGPVAATSSSRRHAAARGRQLGLQQRGARGPPLPRAAADDGHRVADHGARVRAGCWGRARPRLGAMHRSPAATAVAQLPCAGPASLQGCLVQTAPPAPLLCACRYAGVDLAERELGAYCAALSPDEAPEKCWQVRRAAALARAPPALPLRRVPLPSALAARQPAGPSARAFGVPACTLPCPPAPLLPRPTPASAPLPRPTTSSSASARARRTRRSCSAWTTWRTSCCPPAA